MYVHLNSTETALVFAVLDYIGCLINSMVDIRAHPGGHEVNECSGKILKCFTCGHRRSSRLNMVLMWSIECIQGHSSSVHTALKVAPSQLLTLQPHAQKSGTTVCDGVK